jgi:hypothetical protein
MLNGSTPHMRIRALGYEELGCCVLELGLVKWPLSCFPDEQVYIIRVLFLANASSMAYSVGSV